jgi:ATP-dependent protease ClpP protease subunit
MSSIIPRLYKNALLLILMLTSWKLFQADDIQNEANELLRIRDYLFNELASKTGHPVEKVSSL